MTVPCPYLLEGTSGMTRCISHLLIPWPSPRGSVTQLFCWVQSEVEAGDDFEEMSHMDHVPQQWLPPYDGTSLRAGSLASASSLSIAVSDTSEASNRGSTPGLGTVLKGGSRQTGNYRRVATSWPCALKPVQHVLVQMHCSSN